VSEGNADETEIAGSTGGSIKDIRRETRKRYSAEEKINIALGGLPKVRRERLLKKA
jgi:hypothetical protein